MNSSNENAQEFSGGIVVVGIKKQFNISWHPFSKKKTVLEKVNMAFAPGKITGLIGANGTGKTTLFRIIAGILDFDEGEVFIMNEALRGNGRLAHKNVAFLNEKPSLPPEMSGKDILIEYGAMCGWSGEETLDKAKGLIKKMEIESFWDQDSNGYSRGQAVKIALARTLMLDKKCLILDEPTVGLDFKTASVVRKIICEEAEKGKTVVLASHVINDLKEMCHKFEGLENGKNVPSEDVEGWFSDQVRGVSFL